MIEKTINYELFKKHDSNRNLDNPNLEKIKKSIKIKNLLELRPILVDADFYIIDGQHRLEAAKQLNLPIFYQIQESLIPMDMILLNANQKTWKIQDYLNFYVNQNYDEYIKLNNLIKDSNLNAVCGLALCNNYDSGVYKSFREGKFKFPSETSEINAKKLYLKTIQNLLSKKIIGYKRFIFQPNFIRAFLNMANRLDFDFDLLMKKIELNFEFIHRCPTLDLYIIMFKKIYNYKNHNPLED